MTAPHFSRKMRVLKGFNALTINLSSQPFPLAIKP